MAIADGLSEHLCVRLGLVEEYVEILYVYKVDKHLDKKFCKMNGPIIEKM
jgi:hypothetical protein